MTEYLNVWVAGAILCSVPIVTDKQKETVERISQGPRDGQVFMLLEDVPRLAIRV